MTTQFPIKLGFFAKRQAFDLVPGKPEGQFFGVIESGLAMPSGGVGYVAQFDSSKGSRAAILAYIDAFGRVYECDDVVREEPYREADLALYETDCEEDEGGEQLSEGDSAARLDAISKSGARTCVAEVVVHGDQDIRGAVFEYASVDSAFPGDFRVRNSVRYAEFMAVAYLAFIRFGRMNEGNGELPQGGSAKARGAAFDLSAVFDRLATPDVFDAVNREVLEAETSWSDNPETLCGLERYFVHSLRESGLVGVDAPAFSTEEAPDGPHARIVRTTRYADTFYIDFYYNNERECIEDGAFKTSHATNGLRHKLLRAEGAMNRFLLISRYLENSGADFLEEPEAVISDLNESFVDLICLQAPDPSSPVEASGRWQAHLNIAKAAESWRVPHRISYEFCLNEACDEVAFNLATPHRATMAQTRWDEDAKGYVDVSSDALNQAEARYAAHAALLAAACAFHASPDVKSVSVNCLRDGRADDAVISVRFDRERFCVAYASDKEGEHSFASPFRTLAAFDARLQQGDDGLLAPIEPLIELGKGTFSSSFERVVAVDETPFNAEARELLGVDDPMHMSIFEDGLRRKYADEVSAALDSGVESALECLKSIHDRCEDLLVRNICSRLSDAFKLGTLNETSFLEVKEAFTDVYGMRAPMMRASQLMRDYDPAAVGVLEELAAQGDALDGFEDTSLQVFRYFDSYESRALYAKHCADDAQGRMVCALPDEAFLAHDSLAQELTSSIAGADEALDHAKRCIELAPSRAYSYLRAARAYFMKDDFENEVKMCCKAMEVSWNANDTNLALYWLAFSFWKLEKYDAAVACYRRVVNSGANMAGEAKTELEELLQTVKGLKRRSAEQEDELLKNEGVPVDALKENADFLLEAAEASVDSSAVALGCVLAASSARVERDDAIIPVVRALNVTMG